MEALEALNEVEHKIQMAAHVVGKSGQVIESIRARAEKESTPDQSRRQTESKAKPEVKFLAVADVAKRWGCSAITVKRMARKGLIVRTYLGERTIRFAIEEIERYEAECRG